MTIKKNSILFLGLSSLPIFFYLFNLYHKLDHSNIPYLVTGYVTGLIGLFEIIRNRNLNRRILLTFLSLYLLTEMFGMLIVGNADIGDVVRGAFFYCIIGVLLSYPVTYIEGNLQFYITTGVLGSAFLSGAYIHEILTSSGNYLSVLIIFSITIYFIGLHNSKRKLSLVDILPVTLTFLLSIWARGRSGILAGSFIFIFILLYYVWPKKDSKPSFFFYFVHFIILIIIGYLVWVFLDVYEDFVNFSKFDKLGMDANGRDEIWMDYISYASESFVYFLFGAPFSAISSIREMELNPHNSFIVLHAYNGILMTIVFVVLLTNTLRLYIKNNFIFFVITVAYVIRGMTDVFIFGTYGMPLMLYLLLYPYSYNNKKFQLQK